MARETLNELWDALTYELLRVDAMLTVDVWTDEEYDIYERTMNVIRSLHRSMRIASRHRHSQWASGVGDFEEDSGDE